MIEKIGFAKITEVIAKLLDNDQIKVADHKRLSDIESRIKANVNLLTFGDVEIVKMLADEHKMHQVLTRSPA